MRVEPARRQTDGRLDGVDADAPVPLGAKQPGRLEDDAVVRLLLVISESKCSVLLKFHFITFLRNKYLCCYYWKILFLIESSVFATRNRNYSLDQWKKWLCRSESSFPLG